MDKRRLGPEAEAALERVLGYLNFSSGSRDTQFLTSLDQLIRAIGDEGQAENDAEAVDSSNRSDSESKASRETTAENESQNSSDWQLLTSLLNSRLADLKQESSAFQESTQADSVIRYAFDDLLKAYLEFHQDLLFHADSSHLFNSFFLGAAVESVLVQGGPWEDEERIIRGALGRLNNYVGFRPVPTLESKRVEVGPQERLHPVPLFIKEVGTACGPYEQVVTIALDILRDTDEELLRLAHFDLDKLQELAVDPRAYDFDHPVNKRPNHHFGQWDPDTIDASGNYSRFVIQQVTLDALTDRIEDESDNIDAGELLMEAAAVLAGTILMASGVSGRGPSAHDSNVTLTTLLPIIAGYRDAFYERLFVRLDGNHAERLKAESIEKRQPFGGARQHLNAKLARSRAAQLEHVHLAMIYGRMGYPSAAIRQANIVPVASARIFCQIDCEMDAAVQDIQAKKLADACSRMPVIRGLLDRGISCGAIIDPWSILGFDGNFSLFPAIENSVRDHRADDLVGLMEQIMALYSRLWSEAAAVDDQDVSQRIRDEFYDLALWWRQFAAHEVQSVDAVDAMSVFRAAEHVAQALTLWHKGGASTGDVAFWATHTELFDSPKAYALVVDALLQRGDDVASMAILIHWLSRASEVGLEEGDSSFQILAESWMARHFQSAVKTDASIETLVELGHRVRKMYDFMEANAEEYWEVPSFNGHIDVSIVEALDDESEEADGLDSSEDLFSAAYEDVVYRDSTDDGQDGPIFEGGSGFDSEELEVISLEMSERLEFITTLAVMWKLSAGIYAIGSVSHNDGENPSESDAPTICQNEDWKNECQQTLKNWIREASAKRRDLKSLMEKVRQYPLAVKSGDHDSMVEYDRLRLAKESLLDRIISACVSYDDSIRWLLASYQSNLMALHQASGESQTEGSSDKSSDESSSESDSDALSNELAEMEPGELDLSAEDLILVRVFAAVLRRDRSLVESLMPDLMDALDHSTLLYVPMAKGGNPQDIVDARNCQLAIQELLTCLPRLGLLNETRGLLDAAREMERNNPVGLGAVTEFDELFKIGYVAMVESLVQSSETWEDELEDLDTDKRIEHQAALFGLVERLTETMLVTWLAHSRTLRLSVLEKVSEKSGWERLCEFIQRYGHDLFTQRFFNLGNLRAILHQGVAAWLEQLQEDPADYELRLLDELGGQLAHEDAVQSLTLILESIIENYAEYRDYNSTTTQSDQGELLYMLLDFLRLRTQYDRVAWHLRPVVWSHATLVKHGQKQAARLWRRALNDRLGKEPDKYLDRLAKLQKKYAMRMPTVADRLNERFIQPLQIDRIKALVEPAMKDVGTQASRRAFELLEHEVELLTREPSGVGLDIPPWLASLEDEVEQVRHRMHELEIDPWEMVAPIRISYLDAKSQLKEMHKQSDESD